MFLGPGEFDYHICGPGKDEIAEGKPNDQFLNLVTNIREGVCLSSWGWREDILTKMTQKEYCNFIVFLLHFSG